MVASSFNSILLCVPPHQAFTLINKGLEAAVPTQCRAHCSLSPLHNGLEMSGVLSHSKSKFIFQPKITDQYLVDLILVFVGFSSVREEISSADSWPFTIFYFFIKLLIQKSCGYMREVLFLYLPRI